MIYTGGGGIAFLVWLATAWGGYYVIAAFVVDPWIALAGSCVAAALITFALGRSLNRYGNDHTFGFVPAQWIGVAAPVFFGVVFGIAELIRAF